jgi:hypothetical protein
MNNQDRPKLNKREEALFWLGAGALAYMWWMAKDLHFVTIPSGLGFEMHRKCESESFLTIALGAISGTFLAVRYILLQRFVLKPPLPGAEFWSWVLAEVLCHSHTIVPRGYMWSGVWALGIVPAVMLDAVGLAIFLGFFGLPLLEREVQLLPKLFRIVAYPFAWLGRWIEAGVETRVADDDARRSRTEAEASSASLGGERRTHEEVIAAAPPLLPQPTVIGLSDGDIITGPDGVTRWRYEAPQNLRQTTQTSMTFSLELREDQDQRCPAST